MQESDYSNEEFFFMPVKKKTMLKFLLLFPDASEEAYIASVDAFYSASLDITKAGRERRAAAQTQPKQQSPSPVVLEQPYVKGELPEEAKKYYW